MSTRPTLATIVCPKCNQTLPGWATTCQFCNTPLPANTVRPVAAAAAARNYSVNDRSWQEVAYTIMSAIMALNGIYSIASGLGAFGSVGASPVGVVVGGIDMVLGVGLICHQSWAQGVINVFAWLNLAVGLITMVTTIPLMASVGSSLHVGGGVILLAIAFTVYNVIYWGFMIYLIGCVADF